MLMGILYTDYPPNGVWQVKTEVGRKLVRLAWLIWGTAMAAQFLNLFHRIAGATVADRLMADFNLSATAVGTLMALLFYVYGFMQFPSGALADSLGPRKTLSLGCLVASLGAIVFGLAPSLPVLFVGRFLVSLGVSVVFVGVLKITAEWFRSRDFGFITALTMVICQGGALIATTPLALLVTWAGWRASFQLIGLLSLGISLACWLIIRNRPHDLGLPSPSEFEEEQSGSLALSSTAASLSSDCALQVMHSQREVSAHPASRTGSSLIAMFLAATITATITTRPKTGHERTYGSNPKWSRTLY